MREYLELLKYVKKNGVKKADRTGTGTISTFGYQVRYDLRYDFPLVTTKRVFTKGVIHELLWFLKGDTNIKYLVDNGVHIWDDWADENGELGPIYGAQWRRWKTSDGDEIDQISNLIKEIKGDRDSRRMAVSSWNIGEIGKMKLPPCHCLFQFNVANGVLSCQLYQRSADAFLGVPFNIASYALLTIMIAQVTGLKVGEFIHSFGDLHIYSNHMEQVDLQLSRAPRRKPIVRLNPKVKSIFDFTYEDIEIINYKPHLPIKGKVAV